MFGKNNKSGLDTNPTRQYIKRKYDTDPAFREKVIFYNRLTDLRDMKDKLRNSISFTKAVKIGHSAHVTLPRSWVGKNVLVVNDEFFRQFRSLKGFEKLEIDKLCK